MTNIIIGKNTEDIKDWGKIIQTAYYARDAVISVDKLVEGKPSVSIGFTGNDNNIKILLAAACIAFSQKTGMPLMDLLTDIMNEELRMREFAAEKSRRVREEGVWHEDQE